MNRRTVIKRLGLATVAVVATPTVLGLLNSCTTEAKLWTPQFLTKKQGQILIKMVDVFLPKSELPSATEVNVPEFIDRYMLEVYEVAEQKAFTSAFDKMLIKLEDHTQKQDDDIKSKDLEGFLDAYLKTESEIDQERQNDPNYKGLTTSECLNTIKRFCIDAYITSEKIGEEVLAFDPVPGMYYCGDLNELTEGKRWSLS